MASGGAGIASAQTVANKEVKAVLTGNCGPNAYQTLEAAGVQVITGITGKIREVIEGYQTGRFQATPQPTVSAHFGMGSMGMDPGMGGGIGRGMDRGMGMGIDPGQEFEALKTQMQMLGQQLNEALRRLEKLEQKKD